MSKSTHGIAVDLGASGGKVFLGSFNGSRVALKEVYRFPNGVIRLKNHIYWDVLHIFEEIRKGLAIAGREACDRIASVGIDAWGNDFCLLDKDGNLMENPHSYRDPRTDGVMQKAFQRMSREEIYRHTGVQFMQTNTLYQLYSMVLEKSPLLKAATTHLMIPDLFNYWLTGEKCCEFTEATTTQLVDPYKRSWCQPVLNAMDIPVKIMPPIVKAGTKLGKLEKWLCDDLNIQQVPVIAVGTHDTASAASIIPAYENDYAFLSSGTWSLLGTEVREPLINDAGLYNNFSCYGGVCDTFLVWKNIQGLWLLQECMRSWKEEDSEQTYDELFSLAERAEPFRTFIDPDDRDFLTPGNFPALIHEFSVRTGQQPPKGKTAIVRCILESLALKYHFIFEKLQEVLGRNLGSLYIVGGGSQNTLLNRFTADALGIPVIAGLPEATSLGNYMMQLMALGEVKSLFDSREIVRSSFELSEYQPSNTDAWQDVLHRFADVMSRSTTYNH